MSWWVQSNYIYSLASVLKETQELKGKAKTCILVRDFNGGFISQLKRPKHVM